MSVGNGLGSPWGSDYWNDSKWSGWCQDNPYVVSLCAGAFAGVASETLLFPLDCLKTRLQSRHGFAESGGFRGVYRGVFTAIGAAAPASAIFFSTYESTKHGLAPYDHTNSVLGYCGIGLVASILGELAAGVFRVPVDLVKQRQQAGLGQSFAEVARGVRCTHSSIFMASFQASLLRDITHSSLQFPLYEYLKLVLARCNGLRREDALPTWQAALCGSVAGVISAVLTTPLDLLRTRLNLRGSHAGDERAVEERLKRLKPSALIKEEFWAIYRSKGARGFFAGGACRAAWMGLGGFIFLGSFELAKKHLMGRPERPGPALPGPGSPAESVALSFADPLRGSPLAGSPLATPLAIPSPLAIPRAVLVPPPIVKEQAERQRQLGREPPASFSFTAGLMAGMAVDIPLHPLDTIKTRMQTTEGFMAAGGFNRPWAGLSAVLLVSLPGSAIFFLMYESARHFLERRVPPALQDNKYIPMARDAAAAALADVSACVARVPGEVLKQRMQGLTADGQSLTFRRTVAGVRSEGLGGFFAGFGATAMREVPFSLIQMPLFEELKHRHPWAAAAHQEGNTRQLGFIGIRGLLVSVVVSVPVTVLVCVVDCLCCLLLLLFLLVVVLLVLVLICWLVGWLVAGWLVGWLVGWLLL
ncbi:unnamed protein product [Polarella glacialis]|uniref:Mitochondrial carrier protein n=1 Tax=Polarella glacialis TaxID=89957 RepID=A0A813DQT9_POLGL|nr:unnamed protein product [Polarella glacialis]